MAFSVNKVTLLGNLGKDPEYKVISSGVGVCSFSLATTDRIKNQSGEYEDRTEWHNIECWRGLADTCSKYLKKGSKIYLEGRLKTDSYERDGVTRYMTRIVMSEMVMLSGRDQAQGGGNFAAQSQPYSRRNSDDQTMPPMPNSASQGAAPAPEDQTYNAHMESEKWDDVPF